MPRAVLNPTQVPAGQDWSTSNFTSQKILASNAKYNVLTTTPLAGPGPEGLPPSTAAGGSTLVRDFPDIWYT